MTAKKKDSNKKPAKASNRYWLLATLFFLFLLFLFNPFSQSNEISWLQFEQDILSQGNVEKILVVNKETAEVYIKSDKFSDESQKDVVKNITAKKDLSTL